MVTEKLVDQDYKPGFNDQEWYFGAIMGEKGERDDWMMMGDSAVTTLAGAAAASSVVAMTLF